jgi:elongation factor 1 alpha-like protein
LEQVRLRLAFQQSTSFDNCVQMNFAEFPHVIACLFRCELLRRAGVKLKLAHARGSTSVSAPLAPMRPNFRRPSFWPNTLLLARSLVHIINSHTHTCIAQVRPRLIGITTAATDHDLTMPPKSGFNRTRNVDYDDEYDDDDDYLEEEGEGGDGITEDDKEQMRLGTIQVREALGEFEAGISDAQIQESLWHYYYDVAKTVVYLKNKLGGIQPPKETPKKEKTISKFDQAASAAGQNAPTATGKYTYALNSMESACPVTPSLPPITMPTYDADDFFWDVPWGNVPAHRLGLITIDAPCGRRGLLGGSSKLAALAAKRRKEREEAQAAAPNTTGDADAAVAMLDKLTVKSGTMPSLSGGGEGSKPKYPVRKRPESPKPTPPEEAIKEPEAPPPAIVVESPAERAVASTFASTLCGSSKASQPTIEAFPVPYTNFKDYASVNAFDTPSPDDVVRAAQAKGAGGGRR